MKGTWFVMCMLLFCFCTGCAANSEESTATPGTKHREKAATMRAQKGITESVELNSGYSMPMLGLGTWTLRGDTCEDAVYAAIRCGYRLIDTARYYDNELSLIHI